VLRCIRPHWGRTQRKTFPSGIHRYNLHGPMGRASYICEFHCEMHCVVHVPIGGGYNAIHSQMEFTGITCTPRGGVQVIPVNSTWERVALYPSPMGTYTTQCIPRGNYMGSILGVKTAIFLYLEKRGTRTFFWRPCVPFFKVPKTGFRRRILLSFEGKSGNLKNFLYICVSKCIKTYMFGTRNKKKLIDQILG